jgi:hypothetical protein
MKQSHLLQPHQFRTRNDLFKTRRTQSNLNENAAKSTIASFIPSLITVWLQVRVLPGPPSPIAFGFGNFSNSRSDKTGHRDGKANSLMFVIEDEAQAELQDGRFQTRQQAIAELRFRGT